MQDLFEWLSGKYSAKQEGYFKYVRRKRATTSGAATRQTLAW
jgi:hypothetical protein